MIRDFRALGGDVPGEVFRLGGDLQPWSLGTREKDAFASDLRRYVFDSETEALR
jgi:hypothetical protein